MSDHDTYIEPFAGAVEAERRRQLEKWGDQRHWFYTGEGIPIGHVLGHGTWGPHNTFGELADAVRLQTELSAQRGNVTWENLLMEEVAEAFAERDPELLREELVQCAAVICAWIRDIDRKRGAS